MAISLQKGGNVSLSKEAPGLSRFLLGLGWDTRKSDGADFDLDASAFLVDANGKVRSDADFIFFNQPAAADQSVVHQGDNLTGEGDGDDEVIVVDLSKIAADVDKVVIGVTIHEAETRKQNFGMVSNAFVRVVDEKSDEEVVRYDLSEDFSTETALVFGEIYRRDDEWKFRAVGQGFQGGLGPMARSFGVDI